MKRKWPWLLACFGLCIGSGVAYVGANPLVFNDSLWGHAHCIKIAGRGLWTFAEENGGKFPTHPKGYGNALLLVKEEFYSALTDSGSSADAFHEAKRNNTDLPEDECGRVYIQGLTTKSDSRIALLFDKQPTPGGDHCHFPLRLWAPLGREVLFVGGDSTFVREDAWPEFAREQVELLVKEGIRREDAERLHASSAEP